MNLQIAGTIESIGIVEQKTDKFSVRNFFLVTSDESDRRENIVCFQLINDRTDLIDPYMEGEKINVHFKIDGRYFKDRHFQNLNVSRIERMDAIEFPESDAIDEFLKPSQESIMFEGRQSMKLGEIPDPDVPNDEPEKKQPKTNDTEEFMNDLPF